MKQMMTGYCLQCKKKVEFKVESIKTNPNGTKLYQGRDKDGHKISVIGK